MIKVTTLRLLLTVCFFLTYFSGQGQTIIDSLETALYKHLKGDGYSKDTSVLKTFYRLGQAYKSNKDSANFYYEKAVNYCDEKLNESSYNELEKDYFKYIKGKSLSRQGKNFFYESDYETAQKIGEEAVKFLKKLELSDNEEARSKGLDDLTFTLIWLAVLHQKQGNTDEALYYYDETERYTFITKDTTRRALIYGNIAVLHKNNGRLKEALEFNFKGLKLAEQVKNPARIATVLGNIGVIYKHLKEYEKAESYYDRAIKIYEQLGDSKGLSRMYNNLGIIARHRQE